MNKLYRVYDSQGNYMRTFSDYPSASSYVQAKGNLKTWKIR